MNDIDEEVCHFCEGDGCYELDLDIIDDPINVCDWSTGGELGEIVTCKCCGGSGNAKDCIFW